MKLQIRLLILFITAISVALIVFGIGIYLNVFRISIDQVESTLRLATNQTKNRFSTDEQMVFSELSSFDDDIVVLVWDSDETLLIDGTMQVDIKSLWLDIQPEPDFESNDSRFQTINTPRGDFHIYTLPILTNSGQKIILQAGIKLDSVYELQADLLQMMLISGTSVLLIAGLIAWWMTYTAMEPLQLATATAMQITQTDELSIRIPDTKSPNDEVGLLIHAFNTMLERMEDLFKSQRRFLADISHELRTPLTAIRGNANLMRRMKEFDQESLASIENEVARMTRMVDDLLLLAQGDVGKLPMESNPVELDTLLLEVFQQVRAFAPIQKSIVIDDIDQIVICGDQERLKQVMLNLIANAIKYTPENAHIKLSLGKELHMAFFKVEDNGPGIPAEDIPHIFNRFYRAETARSKESMERKGFGLGLSIANWIVTEHLGRIKVTSYPGFGTTFTVWIPLFEGECPPKALGITGIASSKQKNYRDLRES